MHDILKKLDQLIADKKAELEMVQEDLNKLVVAREAIATMVETPDAVKAAGRVATPPPARSALIAQAAKQQAASKQKETAKRTRRRHTKDFKIQILTELAKAPSQAAVLKRHGLYPGQIHAWRKEKEEGKLDPSEGELAETAPELPIPDAVEVRPAPVETEVGQVPRPATPATDPPDKDEEPEEPNDGPEETELPELPDEDDDEEELLDEPWESPAPPDVPAVDVAPAEPTPPVRLLVLEQPWGEVRPTVRADCVGRPRPCPWFSCKYHTLLDVSPDTGSIVVALGRTTETNRVGSHLRPRNLTRRIPTLSAKRSKQYVSEWEERVLAAFEAAMDQGRPTCVLDMIDTTGGHTLEEVGDLLGVTRERVRQIELYALLQAKRVVDPDLASWEETRSDDRNRPVSF